jgi:hypothetical protein
VTVEVTITLISCVIVQCVNVLLLVYVEAAMAIPCRVLAGVADYKRTTPWSCAQEAKTAIDSTCYLVVALLQSLAVEASGVVTARRLGRLAGTTGASCFHVVRVAPRHWNTGN